MRPLNIVIYNITPAGGVERAAVNLANLLADTFHVSVISLYSTQGQPFYPLDERVKVMHLGVPFTPGLRHYARQNVQTLQALRRLVTFTPNSVTLGMSVNINILLALLSKARTPGRFIGCEHMNYSDAPKVAQLLRRQTYPWLDEVVVLTEADRQTYRAQLGLEAAVIPNQLPFLPAQPSALSAKRLLAVGRYEPAKGFDRMITALAPLLREFPDWQLDLYGKGAQETELQELIRREELNNVTLAGTTRNIEAEYLASAACLLTSHHESFGMTMLEAQACGLPVVAYDVPHGPALLVNEDNGFLIPDGDSAAFAQAVRELMTHTELRQRLGAQARADAQKYAPGTIRQKWLQLLR